MVNGKVMYARRGRKADPGYGSCRQDDLPRRAGELSELGHAVDERNLAEPRERTAEQTDASD
jgi:hypothetical protein